MSKIISPSPHLHGTATTPSLMRDVVIALVPAFALSIYLYGFDALMLTAVAVASCMLFEWLIGRFLLNKGNTLCDWSAVVTGVLLAFNLPSGISPWLVVLGSLVAIGIGKMSFGGLGMNLFNPALVGRVFLLISFPVAMTTFPDAAGTDAFSGATPLAFVKEGIKNGQPVGELLANVDWKSMLLGLKNGSMGEMGTLALLIGGIYLVVRKVITWHIPVFVLGTMAVFAAILHGVDPAHYATPAFHLLTGGALLGAIFMATDYVSSPMSKAGMAVYGVGIGLITMLIRTWGAYPEGISFAILIMNAAVPLINRSVKPARFGVVRATKQ